MSATAIIVIVVVLAIIAGGILTLRGSARTGMPERDVIERAKERARQMDAKDEEDGRD